MSELLRSLRGRTSFASRMTFRCDQSRDWCNIWRPLARSFNTVSMVSIDFSSRKFYVSLRFGPVLPNRL